MVNTLFYKNTKTNINMDLPIHIKHLVNNYMQFSDSTVTSDKIKGF